ncbi:hypothetical protein NC653_014955 [Populus alba x Populus x berolinensis]|uniref:Uncharacterized protein n=1 Tax=Populus alba x Populus x berolinensis TaxID=444605 RepID=A0AAD6QYT4_9ROSI|nr:hypothetical protein NC653_014950 [Populus alba x Populus x berolinensis]KAJ6998967.1 hypothetical protein NC653_014955 [Populus alba x Populus x berolinensis]
MMNERLLGFCFEENASGDTIGGLGFKIDQSQSPIVLATSHSQSSGKLVNLLRLYNIFYEPLLASNTEIKSVLS